MNFDIAKLERLKSATAEIYREQKKTSALSAKLGSLDMRNASPRQYGKMNQDLMANLKYLEKLACGISRLVAELGFNDIDPDRSYHNGWTERK